MTYIWVPHQYTYSALYTIKKGDTGEKVAALQLNLPGLVVDGDFGDKTEAAVKNFQRVRGLTPIDGVAGPLTQSSLIVYHSQQASLDWELRPGTLKSMALKESGLTVAAYAPHPAAVDNGFDLGAYQNSIGPQGDPFEQFYYELSYDVERMAARTAADVRERRNAFRYAPQVELETPSWYGAAVTPPGERYRPWVYAWQLAIFGHNLPAMAENLANLGSAFRDASKDDAYNQSLDQATNGRITTMRQWVVDYIPKATTFINW